MSLASVKLRNRQGRECTVDDLTTLFDLCVVVLDARWPDSYRPLVPAVRRIDDVLSGADCTVGVLVVGADEADVDRLLGPLVPQVAVFVDPDGEAAEALGVRTAPALLWVTTAPDLGGLVEGWDPKAWADVLGRLARKLAWARPVLPRPTDPAPYPGRPLPRQPATSAATTGSDGGR